MTNLEIGFFVVEFSIMAALVIVLKKRGPYHREGVFNLFGTPGILLTIAFITVQLGKVLAWYHGWVF
jgi:hypothetical protein